MFSKIKIVLWASSLNFMSLSCGKDKPKEIFSNQATLKTVVYLVKGTNLKLDFIDSNSVFQTNMVYVDSFKYEFKKGSGASIGISIFKASSSDTIYSWSIFIDNKLYANAFSEGGAYFTVPYN